MSFGIYQASAPVFVRGLTNLSALLDKAIAQGFDETALMEARLAPDMRPFPDQVRMASFSRAAIARLTGREHPKTADDEASFAELQATIKLSIDFIQSIPESAYEGAETRPVQLKLPSLELNFEGAGYLTSFALPNFYFHLSMAYALLRQAGVEIGKRDYLGKLELV